MHTVTSRSRTSRRVRWLIANVLTGALVAGVLGAGPPSPAAAAPVHAEALSPAERAAKSGERVEIVEKTTESSQTFANPDGSLTFEQAIVPVRTKKNGSWVALDATLEQGADGLFRPKAAAVEMAFSNGGGAPLASMKDDGERLDFRWPGTLPKPVVEGDSLTYPSVLPDVDLKITASTSSFTEVLVVRTPKAANSPALREITLGMSSPGLTLRETVASGFEAVDSHGKTVFAGPQPIMWDSSGSGRLEPPASDRTESPLEGDDVAKMSVEITQNSIKLTPSAQMVNDPGTVYPIYIDPPAAGVQSGRAMINQRYPDTATWNWTNPEGMGYQSYEPWSRKRLFFQFLLPMEIQESRIMGSTFSVFETFAASCTPKTVQAWKTGKFGDGATWDAGSGTNVWQRHLSSATVAYGRDGCSPGGYWVPFDVDSAVADQVAARAQYVYLGLRAADESDDLAWKRFRSDARLAIQYNHLPTISMRGFNDYDGGCGSLSNYPIIPDYKPILQAYVGDFNWQEQSVRAEFEVYLTGQNTPIFEHSSYTKAPEDYFQPALTLWNRVEDKPLDNNKVYGWRVRAWDGIHYSAWTSFCYFMLDTSKPTPPKIEILTAPPFKVSKPITARLTASSGDVVRHRYALNDDAPGPVVEGATGTFTFTPTQAGPFFIRAWSYDGGGNGSYKARVHQIAIDPAAEVGEWKMDEGRGTVIGDTSGKGHRLTMGAGVTWSNGNKWLPDPTGANDWAVRTNGLGSTAQSSVNNLFNNRQNFSVTARVRQGERSLRQAAVSEDNGAQSSFTLGVLAHDLTEEKVIWAFTVPDPDGSGEVQAKTGWLPYTPGRWVHLSGTYDAQLHQIRLWVDNGSYGGTSALIPGGRAIADGTGALRIGRGVAASAADHFWLGDIEDVRIFDGVIDKQAVQVLAGEPT